MKTINIYAYLGAIALASLIVYAIAASAVQLPVMGQVGSSLQSHVATSSTIGVGPQLDKTLFTANDLCASRVVSTVGTAVMLSFSSTINPGPTIGHVQAASTTVAYESDEYGCGAVTAYGFASTTITTAEFRY